MYGYFKFDESGIHKKQEMFLGMSVNQLKIKTHRHFKLWYETNAIWIIQNGPFSLFLDLINN